MRETIRDGEHLLRAGALLGAGLVVFFAVAALAIPKDFGIYGHYRAGALDDNRDHPLVFAGHAACEECHADVVAVRTGSRHARIRCETCHGPLAKHAEDPAGVTPERPTKRTLCLGCHTASASRPPTFPQIVPADHAASGDCTDCHPHHHPEPGDAK